MMRNARFHDPYDFRFALCALPYAVLALPPRMILLVDLPEPLPGHLGIDLRCGDVGVAEHGLDRAEVGAVVQEMRRKRVTQGVRRDRDGDARLSCVEFYPFPEHLPRDAPAFRAEDRKSVV